MPAVASLLAGALAQARTGSNSRHVTGGVMIMPLRNSYSFVVVLKSRLMFGLLGKSLDAGTLIALFRSGSDC